MTSCFRRFVSDTSGTTAIEYALIGTLIVVVIVGAVGLVGTQVSGRFTSVASTVAAAVGQ
jgi:pilus assembly protein Flp/PilA